MDNRIHVQASPDILRALSLFTSAVARHLLKTSKSSFTHSPQFFFPLLARAFLCPIESETHTLFTIFTIPHSFPDLYTFVYIFLAAQYRLVQVPDSTSGKCYSLSYLQIL